MINTAQKIKCFIKDSSSKSDHIRRFPADPFTFTEKILNGKLRNGNFENEL